MSPPWCAQTELLVDMSCQLAGQEIIAIWCGNVWGVWIGFGIVAAGTIIGELATFLCVSYYPPLAPDALTLTTDSSIAPLRRSAPRAGRSKR